MAVQKEKATNSATMEAVIKATPVIEDVVPGVVIKTLSPKELAEQEDRRMEQHPLLLE